MPTNNTDFTTPVNTPLATPPSTPPPKKTKLRYDEKVVNKAEKHLEGYETQDSRKRNLKNLFEDSFCVGESHSSISSKRFLIENMSRLQKEGFTHIFLEHFTQEHQSLLNSKNKQDRKQLGIYLNDLNEGHMSLSLLNEPQKSLAEQYNFKTLIHEAQKYGITIVALDDQKEYKHPLLKDGYDRTCSFNSRTIETIEYTEEKGKWFALVGESHLNSFRSVVGIADALDVQDIVIGDNNNSQEIKVTVTDQKQAIKNSNKQFGALGVFTKDEILLASIFLNADPSKSLKLEKLRNLQEPKGQKLEYPDLFAGEEPSLGLITQQDNVLPPSAIEKATITPLRESPLQNISG